MLPRSDGGLAPWPSAVSRFVAWLDDNAMGSAGYFLISVTGTEATGKEPLVAVMLEGGHVVARDRKTCHLPQADLT